MTLVGESADSPTPLDEPVARGWANAGVSARVTRPDAMAVSHRDLWTTWCGPQSPWTSPFLHPAFAEAMGRARPDARVAAVSRNDEPAAFFAFVKRPAGFARAIGAPLNGLQALVTPPSATVDLSQALRAAGLSAWHTPALYDPYAVAERAGDPAEAFHAALLTDDAFEQAQNAYAPKERKEAARRRRKAAREIAEPVFTLDDRDPALLNWLIERKRAQFHHTGRHDVLAPVWARALLADLIARGDGEPVRARFASLRMGERVAAVELALLAPSVRHSWFIAYDADFAPYSPGVMLAQDVLAAIAGAGVARYDLGAGHAHLKRPRTTFSLPVRDATVVAAGAAGRARAVAGKAWRAVEEGPVAPAARLAGQARRRGAVILAAETSWTGRARGFAAALRPKADRSR